MAFERGQLVPFGGFGKILLAALAKGVALRQIVTGAGMAFFSGDAEIFDRLLHILRDLVAFIIHHCQGVTGVQIALLGGSEIPLHGLVKVFFHAGAVVIAHC